MADLIRENPEISISEELASVLAQLSTDQIRFVVARQECATDKEAAEAIGIKPDTVYHWPDAVKEATRFVAGDGIVVATHLRRRNLAKAMLVKVAGLDSDDERLRQAVATEVIEWEMGKAKQPQEHTGKDGGAIETKDVSDLTDAERIARVLALVDRARERRDSDALPAEGDE